jgi:hypothetical protein
MMSDNHNNIDSQVEVIEMNAGNVSDVELPKPSATANLSATATRSFDKSPADNDNERRKLITWIKMAVHKFPNKINDVDISQIDNLPVSELEKIKSHIRFVLRSHTSDTFQLNALAAGLKGVEIIGTNFAGLKLQGYTEVCLSQEAVIDTYKELMLDYDFLGDMPPGVRLCLTLMQVGVTVHLHNSKMEVAKVELDDPAPQEANEMYEDL